MELLFNALNAHNIPEPNRGIKADGFTRWGKNSRYWAVRLGDAGWCFGDWSTGEQYSVFADPGHTPTPDEKRHLRELLQAEREKYRAEQTVRQEQAAKGAANILATCVSAVDCEHPYLTRKGIKATNGVFIDRDMNVLNIPLQDCDGKLWNLQSIFANGDKRFLSGGRTKGCFHLIGDSLSDSRRAFVCEGYATGVSIAQATDSPVIVACCAKNVGPVVADITRQYPQVELIIAADNDQDKDPNTGVSTAVEVAQKFGLRAIIPQFPDGATGMSDFNDLHNLCGIEAVRSQFFEGGVL